MVSLVIKCSYRRSVKEAGKKGYDSLFLLYNLLFLYRVLFPRYRFLLFNLVFFSAYRVLECLMRFPNALTDVDGVCGLAHWVTDLYSFFQTSFFTI